MIRRRIPVPSSTEEYFDRLGTLLELESQAEARQVVELVRGLPPAEAEAAGHSLVDLVSHDGYAGLGGRFLLVLGKRNREQRLPWTRLGPGTPVILTMQAQRGGRDGYRGVVAERDSTAIRVAFDDLPEEEPAGTFFRIDIAPDEAARLRQRQALQRARAACRDRLAELRSVLLGERLPEFGPIPDDRPLDPALNHSQRQAVGFALSAEDVAVLHGPPGSGKTTTVVELIRRAVRQGQRVLVCAPSNLAVDNVLERLLAWSEKAVRLGHPARVLPALREHTLDILVEEHADARQARKLVKEAFALFRQAGKWTRARPEPGARQQLRQEARSLLTDARQLEGRAVERVLDSAPILCATTTGLDDELLGSRHFDLVVLDEACQSTEPGCWPALNRADRVVLAGDHCQLPPTVLSSEAGRQGLGISLLERLVEQHGERITRRLDVQYRMHEQIMGFSSAEFYDGTLQADPSVARHLLCEVPGVALTPLTLAPMTFLDTAGAGYDEEQEPDEASRLNPQEAALAAAKVRALVEAGVRPEDIAVITPYSAQVRRLRTILKDLEGLEIDSVDGFQGREKEAVVLSLVRSNAEGAIGFLADVRRTNVALTRARRCLIVIGDSATLAALPFYQRFCEHVERIGAYRTVWEEV
jgi:superfamily I DNA and/or RNA helicase